MDFHLWLCANKSYVVAFFPQVLYVSQAEHIEIARWMKRLGTLKLHVEWSDYRHIARDDKLILLDHCYYLWMRLLTASFSPGFSDNLLVQVYTTGPGCLKVGQRYP